MFKRIVIAAALAVMFITLSISGQAQTKIGVVIPRASLMDLVQRAREGRSATDPKIVAQINEAYAAAESRVENGQFARDLTGSWNVQIPESDGGAPPFEALHTFGADGTFIETSSLLGTRTEGPAHGVWSRTLNGFVLTFELFAFDPETGNAVGRVRVRNFIQYSDRTANKFQSLSTVDFIEPDGNEIRDIDGGPYTATRINLAGL
jgi:hypothetical protein